MSASEPLLGNSTKLASTPADFVAKYSFTALRFYLLSLARDILKDSRIQVCWRYPLPDRAAIELIYSKERRRARAVGTMKCGSVWTCPVCSLYIGERRREELGKALFNARDKYAVVMVTYTIQHHRGMLLREMLAQMQSAYADVHSGRAWQEIKAEFALCGSVRAVEITHGDSGWHPHYHEMVLVSIEHIREYFEGHLPEYAEGLQAVLSERWIAMLEKNGLTASDERGITVRCANDEIAGYVAKWGKMPSEHDFKSSADEITRGRSKMARNGSQSVWDILFNTPHDPRARFLFEEYAVATKGRSQLQWSRGLKSELGIDEIRDEIAAEGVATETDILLASIDLQIWRFMAERGYIGQLMTFANAGEANRVEWMLGEIKAQFATFYRPLPQMDIGL